jgi:hypothetical protein
MKVTYEVVSHDYDREIRMTGDWSGGPSANELLYVLGKTKPVVGMELSTQFCKVRIKEIKERQKSKCIVFTRSGG